MTIGPVIKIEVSEIGLAELCHHMSPFVVLPIARKKICSEIPFLHM